MRSHIIAARALCFTPSLAAAAHLSFIADEQAFCRLHGRAWRRGGLSHCRHYQSGAQPIEIRIHRGDRPSDSAYATLAPGASASFVMLDSLFVSCAAEACRTPVEVNYLPAF
jgi:hypothetical protein